MRLWYVRPEGPFFPIAPRLTHRFYLAMFGMGLLVCHAPHDLVSIAPPAFASSIPAAPMQRSGQAASPHVGAAMAVLATLEQARVLPPEGTKDADRVIKSVIQIQSLFMKSADPAVREFLRRAVATNGEHQAAEASARFQSNGWTPDVLTALADATSAAHPDELQSLAAGLTVFNLSVGDFRDFMRLVRDGEQALSLEGRTFHEVFASQRRMMPGSATR